MWQDPEVWQLQVALWAFGATMLPFAFVIVVLVYVSYLGGRAKGYQPTIAALIVLAGFVTGILVTVLTKAIPPSRTSGVFALLFFVFWVPLLFSAAAIAVLLFVLPQRRTRVFGPRKVGFPFVAVGKTLLVAPGLAFIIAAWAAGNSVWSSTVAGLIITALLWPTALYLIRRGRRLETAMPVEEVLSEDGRPPVLYLRAFSQESQFFVIGAQSAYGAYARSLHASMGGGDIGLTFEEFLSDAVSAGIGPLVALGSPEDYFPPEGAVRLYADDTHWKERFDRWAREAACIVAEVGRSGNLSWELTHLRAAGLQKKLFVFTSYFWTGSKLSCAFWNCLWLLKGQRRVGWSESARELSKLGYDIAFPDPGPGSVIAFDATGSGVVVTTGAREPGDFVESIRTWLHAREKTGRHHPVSCSSCGKSFYITGVHAATEEKFWCEACELTAFPGFRRNRMLQRAVGSVYWAGLLCFPLAATSIMSFFAPRAPASARLLGVVVAGVILAAAAVHILVLKRAWDGAPKDDATAAAWYRSAAGAGSVGAMVNLGVMYRRGWGGLPTDDVKAEGWYRRAAEAGHPAGMHNLGFMYENGLGGLPQSQADAIHWYGKAARLGFTIAQDALTRLRVTLKR